MNDVSVLARQVVQALREKQKTLSVMESCTGGLLSSLLTDVEGASEVFPCGYVTYSNAAKLAAGVDAEVLAQSGVYSAPCAEAMARAAKAAAQTDCAVGVTGTLGRRDPANADSLPGEVFFCLLCGETVIAERLTLDAALPRPEAKLRTAEAILTRLAAIL